MSRTDDKDSVLYYLPDKTTCQRLADFFQVFCDPTRLRLLSALALSRLSVGDIASLLETNQTTVSHQLRNLRNLGAVRYEREGKTIYYSLCDNTINEVLLLGVDYVFEKKENG